METIKKIKKFLPLKNVTDGSSEPQLGYKVRFCMKTRRLFVKIIGARNLPSIYGNSKAKGYFVKLTLFPSRQKYETELYRDSNPTINVEFSFDFPTAASHKKRIESTTTATSPFSGEFLSFTIYSVLNVHETRHVTSAGAGDAIRTFFGVKKNVRDGPHQTSDASLKRESRIRNSFKNRRDIGTITCRLDDREFSVTGKDELAMLDSWKQIGKIYTGIDNKLGGKGTIDLCLRCTHDDNDNDLTIEASLLKFYCSKITMQEHEKFGGSLYIKMVLLENDQKLRKSKTKPFDPTISLLVDSGSTSLKVKFPEYTFNNIKLKVVLQCITKLQKKITLGTVELGSASETWTQMRDNPNMEINNFYYFV